MQPTHSQLPNLILPICGNGRLHRASKPPPNSLPGMIFRNTLPQIGKLRFGSCAGEVAFPPSNEDITLA